MFVDGGGDSIGPGTVVVTPDPGLLQADPGVMQSAAGTFSTAAHQLYSVATATKGAAGKLTVGWKGKGASSFSGTASDTNWYSASAAEGMMGASIALSSLSKSISAAQTLARAAMKLAASTNQAADALNRAYANSQADAVSKLPAKATPEQVSQAMAPTAGQSAQADLLSGDATRATTLMTEANTQARAAWRAATAAFDAVTSQSPSVQLAAISVRAKDFSQSMDSAGTLALLMMAAGAASGDVPGGDDEDEDDVDPALWKEAETDDPDLAADIKGEEGMTVDGDKMDPAIAADVQGVVPVGYSDYVTVMTAYEDAALNPATSSMVAGTDPLAGLSPSEYQAKYWDPTAKAAYGTGNWIYPPDNGADLSSSITTKDFSPGDTFDRFGQPSGSFASPEGTPWDQRSLPPTSLVNSGGGSSYHVYEVTSKWETDPPDVLVTQAKVASAFGQPGGGIQYTFENSAGTRVSIESLIKEGYVQEISP